MRVCVSGGDVTGLVVAYVCRVLGHSVVLVEAGKLGAQAFDCSHKFLERSDEVCAMLDRLGVVYDEYTLSTGLLSHGAVVRCPRRVSPAVHHAHWRKTRLTAWPVDCVGMGKAAGMNEPEVTSKRYAISCDWHDLVKRLSAGLTVARAYGSHAQNADLVLETRALWESTLATGVSDAMAVALTLVTVQAQRERYLRWDIVYTPHTPGDAIFRLYHGDSGYVCEFSGERNEDALISDLNFLFPEGWKIEAVTHGNGKLVSLQERPVWPHKAWPLGRLAQWDELASLTRVIRDTQALLERVSHAHAG